MSSPVIVLAEAIKAHLLAAFPAPVDPAPAVHPTIARRWRVDLMREDIPANGLLYVTLGAATRERGTRVKWKPGYAINVVSVAGVVNDSKEGPSNGDAFSDLHHAIGLALEAFPEGARSIQLFDEQLPMQGQTDDGTDILISSFTLTFK